MESIYRRLIHNYSLLLDPKNNSYKYLHFYKTQFDSFHNQTCDPEQMCRHTVLIMTNILSERTKTRFHCNDSKAKGFEKQILRDGKSILWYDFHKLLLQKRINQLLRNPLDEEYLMAHNQMFGTYEMKLNYDPVEEIQAYNIEPLQLNINRLRRVDEERIRAEHLNEESEYKYVDNYLTLLI